MYFLLVNFCSYFFYIIVNHVMLSCFYCKQCEIIKCEVWPYQPIVTMVHITKSQWVYGQLHQCFKFSTWFIEQKTHKSFNKAISANLHNHLTRNPSTPDQICNSPYCQPYNSYNVNSENLVLYQLIITNWYFYLLSPIIWLMLHWYCKEKAVSLGHSWELTLMSDQDKTSPYNINTISSEKEPRIKKNIN